MQSENQKESNPHYREELFVTDDASLVRRMRYFRIEETECLDPRYPGALELILFGTNDYAAYVNYDHLVVSPETGRVYKKHDLKEGVQVECASPYFGRGDGNCYAPSDYKDISSGRGYLHDLRPISVAYQPSETDETKKLTRQDMIQMTKDELADLRRRGSLFPPKIEVVINAVNKGVSRGYFSLDEVGTSESELTCLIRQMEVNEK